MVSRPVRVIAVVCVIILALGAFGVWIRYDELPDPIPMFLGMNGHALKACPRSFVTAARLPLMHLILVSALSLIADRLPPKGPWAGVSIAVILAATSKGSIELAQLMFGGRPSVWLAASPVVVVLLGLVGFLWAGGWKLDAPISKGGVASNLLLAAAALTYGLLVSMPVWVCGF